jgi:hypothetical protein
MKTESSHHSRLRNNLWFLTAITLVTVVFFIILGSIQQLATTGKIVAADSAPQLPEGTIQPPESPRKVDITIAVPQPLNQNAASSVTPPPTHLLTSSDLSVPHSPSWDFNMSGDSFPPSLAIPDTAANLSSNSTASVQGTCGTWYPQAGNNCWHVANQGISNCTVDMNKRAIAYTLVYPQYWFNVSFNRSDAKIWHRFWMWDQGQWHTSGWSPNPHYQLVQTDGFLPVDNIAFSQRLYYSPAGTIGGTGWGLVTLEGSSGSGISGPRWLVIERYISLKQLYGDPPVNIHEYVRFNNGSIYCGHNFPASMQSAITLDEESFMVHLAPTPPGGGPPNHTFLPLIVRPAGSGISPTPAPTATPYVPVPPTPSSSPITGNPQNADFDAGPHVGWTEYSSQGYGVVLPGPKGFEARSGQYLAWLGGVHNDVSSISQVLTVPASHPFLTLHLMATSQEDLCQYDRAAVLINEYQVASIGLCKPQNSHSWLKAQIDLRDFAGQTVTLTIKVETDDSLLSSLFVDDLSFESGVLIPTLAPSPTPVPSGGAILNPGFELGNNGNWTSYTTSGAGNIFLHSGAHSGNWLAWLGGLNNEVGYIEQTVSIPSDKPYLTYWGWISSAETTCGGDYVWFLAGSTALYGYNLCTPYNSSSWGQGWVNLTAYAGTTQTIRIRVQTNGTLISSLYLDDFAFAASPPAGMSLESGAQPLGMSIGANAATPTANQSPAIELQFKER